MEKPLPNAKTLSDYALDTATPSDRDFAEPIDERERRLQLRQKGWNQCLEGLGIAGMCVLVLLLSHWIFDYRPRVMFYVPFGFAFWIFITGLVNILKGCARSGGKVIS